MESEQSLGDLQDTLKQTRIHGTGILEEEKIGSEKLFKEIKAENFPNLRTFIDTQIQEPQHLQLR